MSGLKVGYPGLTHTAKLIADFIGPCDTFCEPFAGLGRVSKFIKCRELILNDRSDFSVSYLRKNFPVAIVTDFDFEEAIRLADSPETTFLFDPPWSRTDYADNPKTFCDRGVGDYYRKLAEIAPTLKGRWFCAGRVSGGARSTVSVYFKEFDHVILRSDRTIGGHPVQTKLYFERR